MGDGHNYNINIHCEYYYHENIYTIMILIIQKGTEVIDVRKGSEFQLRRTMYTSGKVTHSLFRSSVLCWMYQLSIRQRMAVCGWQSTTSKLLRSTTWPVASVCSAIEHAATLLFLRA